MKWIHVMKEWVKGRTGNELKEKMRIMSFQQNDVHKNQSDDCIRVNKMLKWIIETKNKCKMSDSFFLPEKIHTQMSDWRM